MKEGIRRAVVRARITLSNVRRRPATHVERTTTIRAALEGMALTEARAAVALEDLGLARGVLERAPADDERARQRNG